VREDQAAFMRDIHLLHVESFATIQRQTNLGQICREGQNDFSVLQKNRAVITWYLTNKSMQRS